MDDTIVRMRERRGGGGRMDKACLVKGKKGCCMHEFDLIIIIYPQAMGYKSKV